MVPPSSAGAMPSDSPASWYIRSSRLAGALMVMDVVTRSMGSRRHRTFMSSSVSIATPTFPTSPAASGASES